MYGHHLRKIFGSEWSTNPEMSKFHVLFWPFVFSPPALALGSLAIVKVSERPPVKVSERPPPLAFLGANSVGLEKGSLGSVEGSPNFSPTALALGSSAIVKRFFAANRFRLPKGSLECSPQNSLHLSHILLRFFFRKWLLLQKRFSGGFRQLCFTFISQCPPGVKVA